MFSIKLKTLREEKRISQRDLAKILGISQGSVGNWEAGTREPDFKTVKKIADFFDVSIDYLIGRNVPTNIETFTRQPAKVESFDRKDAQKKEAPSDLFKETEEAYIKMLAEEEGTSVDDLHLSEERRRQLRRVILSLLKE